MKKRIAIVISHLGLGGAERVTTVISNYLIQSNYDVFLFVFSSEHKEYELNDRIRKIQLPEHKNKIIKIYQQIHAYDEMIKNISPDYIIALSMYRYLCFSNTINRYNYIFSERNDPGNHKVVDRMIQRHLFKKAYGVVFQTEEAKNYYIGVNIRKSEVIMNPIIENLPEPFWGIRDKRIVAFSRLTRQKNIEMLLRAFQKFINYFPDYVLDIYGEGECKDELVQLCDILDIKNKVRFWGFVSDIHERIKTSTMFVSSSDYEGVSNSMIEAMAMGLPVVCTDCPCGGAREIIRNGENGFLINVGDIDDLVKKMIYIAENPEISETLGRSATHVREKLSTKKIVSEWIKLMESDQ